MRSLLFLLLSLSAAPAFAQAISLSTAVVELRGAFGQSTSQTFTMSNRTGIDLEFELIAQDVIVRGGKRIFVDAGELPGGIAATAVFSPKQIFET